MEQHAAEDLPAGWAQAKLGPAAAIVDSLDPGFRAQQLGFAVSQIAANAAFAAAAERRSFLDRLLGRQPAGFPGPLAAAQRRAFAHLERHSVWLHNSVRGAIGLAIAVLVADLSGVQHAFWVVLGTLSVLRSNALATGQNILRGLAGTAIGFFVGALLLEAIGKDTTIIWFLLPLSVLLAAVAPGGGLVRRRSGGVHGDDRPALQHHPAGGLAGRARADRGRRARLRGEPRGRGALLAARRRRRARAGALRGVCRERPVSRGRRSGSRSAAATSACRAARRPRSSRSAPRRAAQRLDDAFRSYLAERGAKPVSLADVSGLVAGVASLRLTSEAVLDLWDEAGSDSRDDRTAARGELLESTAAVEGWYETLAVALAGHGAVPAALAPDEAANARLVEVVRRDLGGESEAVAVAVRILWTGDHLDAARRLQAGLVAPARTVTERAIRTLPVLRRLTPQHG